MIEVATISTSPVASFNMPGRTRHPGAIGYPVWGVEMAILDDKDQPLSDGERGEICIRGHNVMKGYLGRPDATREALRGGWFHSGDLGVVHPDGYIELRDRKKDIIISGGENISTIEVEHTLVKHPAVLECAVVSMPHEKWGEVPKAFVSSPVATMISSMTGIMRGGLGNPRKSSPSAGRYMSVGQGT